MLHCLMERLQSNVHHIVQYGIKRKEKEQFKSMGFSLEENTSDDSTILTYDWVPQI